MNVMNTDTAEHEMEDPVVPQFASEDPAQDQNETVEAKGDNGDQVTPADAAPASEEQKDETVKLEVTEEIQVTETITVSRNKEETAAECPSEVASEDLDADTEKGDKKETASG